MNIWWVRHGPTHMKTMIGWTDVPADLSDQAQIARLDDYLPRDAPVLSSDLKRASQTADRLTATRPRLPHDPRLREIHFGRWEKRTFDAIEATEPDRIRRFWQEPGEISAPDGESWDRLRQRVGDAVENLQGSEHPELIVVAHFGVILTQLQLALGLTTTKVFSHRIDNFAVTRIRYGPGQGADPINHLP